MFLVRRARVKKLCLPLFTSWLVPPQRNGGSLNDQREGLLELLKGIGNGPSTSALAVNARKQ